MKNEKEKARECCQLERVCNGEGRREPGLMGRCGWWVHVVRAVRWGGHRWGCWRNRNHSRADTRRLLAVCGMLVYYVVYLI